MENAGKFYGHLEYFTVIWCILWPCGNAAVICYYFPSFWFIVFKTIWQPWTRRQWKWEK
jgi:hypothetical protein